MTRWACLINVCFMASERTLTSASRAPRETRQQRRHEIAAAARKILSTQGKELTIGNIAASLGLSEAALYRHVANKHEILALALDDARVTLLGALAKAAEEGGSATQKLERMLNAHLSYAERRRGVALLVINETLRLDDAKLRALAREIIEQYLELVRGVLASGQLSGEIRHDLDLEAAARLFFGMAQSTITLWLLGSRSFSLTNGDHGLWSIYVKSVRAAGSSTTQALPTG